MAALEEQSAKGMHPKRTHLFSLSLFSSLSLPPTRHSLALTDTPELVHGAHVVVGMNRKLEIALHTCLECTGRCRLVQV